jgi:hypothetical protein
MFIVALAAVLIAYKIGFNMAMKIREIKVEQNKEQETKIQRFISILTDFIDEKVVKVTKPYAEEIETVDINGKQHDARTFF